MEYLGCGAFSRCESLRSITLPSSVAHMKHPHTRSDEVFDNCYSIEKVMMKSSIHHIDSEVVLFLLDNIIYENPELSQTPCTADSCLPLHLFIMFGYCTTYQNCLEDLIHAAPKSLTLCDPVYNMYPFQLAACTPLFKKEVKLESRTHIIIQKEKEQLDTIYLLLRQAPEVVQHLISNQTPYLDDG